MNGSGRSSVSSMQYNEPYRPLTARYALQLAAPHTWAASVCPSLFGISMCLIRGYPLTPLKALMVTAACVFLQSAVNTLNDYVDYVKGTDSASDHVEVSDAVLVYGHVDPKSARNLGLLYLSAGLLCGLIASAGAGSLPILIGAVGGLTVLLYSGGPLPVSSLPIGEVVSGTVMGGLIPLGAAACADERLHPEVFLYSLPCIIGIALIMMSNNGCDIEKDRRAGRNTLPSILGRERTLKVYRFLTGVWILLLLAVPLALAGARGCLVIVLLLLSARKPFGNIFRLKLAPEQRVLQMKSITAANAAGNGSLAAALFIAALMEKLHV